MSDASPSVLDMLLDLTCEPPPSKVSRRPRTRDLPPGVRMETRERGDVVLLVDEADGWVREWHRCRGWQLLRAAVEPGELDLWRCSYLYGNAQLCGAVYRGDPPADAEACRRYRPTHLDAPAGA